ncbi:MAG: aminotransferase class I/II-fold pyridoxal phosphate-dependent enzyme [Myxococcales bacterium]|nr:aminotransferase class I/II-fold pyridoxal phosphate-dependent enzyme [Myxococcales bacterium]
MTTADAGGCTPLDAQRELPSRLHLDATRPYRIPDYERAGWLRLDVNEHAGGAPAFVIDALRDGLTAATVATYPCYTAWLALAAEHFGVRTDQLTPTAGGDEAIKAICEAFLLPGRPLVTLDPGYDMFRIWANLYGNPLHAVPLGAGFAFDGPAWFDALAGSVGLIAIVSPNNPTGTLVPRDVIEATLSRVRCAVVVDETYADFSGTTVCDLVDQYPNLFVVRSFSKAHGLAGLRAGAVVASAANIDALRCVLNPFNVSRPAIVASMAVMERPQAVRQHVADVMIARTEFVAALRDLGIETAPAHANFVLANLGAQAGSVVAGLRAEGILVRDRTGTHARLDGWVRIAIGSSSQMRRCAGALRKRLVSAPKITTLLLDMDGVLVDVSASYRCAILETAREFLGRSGAPASVIDQVDDATVEALKRSGGLNNDWDCTIALLHQFGVDVPRHQIVEAFQQRYWGNDGTGYIAREPWLVPAAVVGRIGRRFTTAIVTGRPRTEAIFTLRRHAVSDTWPIVVALEDAEPPKPHAAPILCALEQLRRSGASGSADLAAYVGDGVDDMRAAVAAGVLPVGVLPPQATWDDGLVDRLYDAGAHCVFASVEEVVGWLEAATRK